MRQREFVGEKYEGGRDTAEIAKKLRVDIKQAVGTGVLPGTVKDYTVRIERFSGGSAIRVNLLNHTHFWAMGTDAYGMERQMLTEEGLAVNKTLEWMVQRYNRDNSDTQVDYWDVDFYHSVNIETPHGQSFRLAEAERKAEARKNAKAKKALVEHLVAEHGQRKGKLRNYTYDRLVDAHDNHFGSCDFESKEPTR